MTDTSAIGEPTGPGEGTIVCDDVSRWFGSVVAVSDVSIRFGPGVTALLGPNGAGKSTLFRMIVGLLPVSRGTIRVLGRDPRTDLAIRGRIGLVPQQDALFDGLSALDCGGSRPRCTESRTRPPLRRRPCGRSASTPPKVGLSADTPRACANE